VIADSGKVPVEEIRTRYQQLPPPFLSWSAGIYWAGGLRWWFLTSVGVIRSASQMEYFRATAASSSLIGISLK